MGDTRVPVMRKDPKQLLKCKRDKNSQNRLFKATSLLTSRGFELSQAIPYMRSDIFNFVYHLLTNNFLNPSAQEHLTLVKGNVFNKFHADFSHCI